MAVQTINMGLDCQSCNEVLKRERGCTSTGILPFEINGEYVWRCPLKVLDASCWEYINAYAFFKKGFLPNGQGWLNESFKYCQAMMVIDGEYNKLQQEKIKNGRNKT